MILMNRSFHTIIVLICWFQIGCIETSRNSEFPSERIEIANAKETQLLAEDIFQKVSMIKLDLSECGALGKVKKIVCHNSKVYVFDRRFNIGIHVFDLAGKHMFSINTLGHGPGEIMEPLDFTINRSDDQIVISDLVKGILFFSEGGSFLRELKFPFENIDGYGSMKVNHIEHLFSDNYFFSRLISGKGGKSFRHGRRIFLGSFDSLTDSLISYSEENFNNNNVNFTLPYSFDGNYLIYWRMFSDTIYQLNCKDLPTTVQRFYVDFGRSKMTPSFLRQPIDDRIRYLQQPAGRIFDGFSDQVFDLGSNLFFSFVSHLQGNAGSKMLALFNKEKNILEVSNGLQIESPNVLVSEIEFRADYEILASFLSSDDSDFEKANLENITSSDDVSQYVILFHL